MKRQRFRNGLLVAAGVASLGLATIGIVVPLLPTTPFLLLSAACFIRSSDRLYRWLMTHRVFGTYIRNYREHRALSKTSKVVVLLLLWTTISYTAVWVISSPLLQFILVLIALGVTVHILSLATLSKAGLPENTSRKYRA